MKYIRTENGILKTENLKLIEDDRFGRRYINCYNFPYIPLKESDTIEELCDEFVVVNLKYNIHRFYDKTKSDWTLQTYACSPTHIVYGCIWTDKGLIYVAKMNDKGDLELI